MPGQTHSYLRLSAARDGDAETLESQRQTCQRLAAEHGLVISREWNEGSGMSARSGSQPVFQELLSSVGSGDVVITWEVSRLTRNGHTTGQLRQLVADGVRILTPQLDTADRAGLLSFALFAELAIAESEDKSARVRAGKDRQRRAGEFMGGIAPWGFRLADGPLVVDEEVAPRAKQLIADYLAGASVRSLVNQLNTEGVPSARGGKWTASSLTRWIQLDTLAGLVDGEVRWPGLISVAEHRRIRAEAERRTTRTTAGAKTGKRTGDRLLSSIARCGSCGGAMVFDQNGSSASRYRCHASSVGGNAACPRRVMANAEVLEEMVVARSLIRLGALEPDAPEYEEIARRWGLVENPADNAQRSTLQEDLAATEQRLETIASMFAGGTLDTDQFATMTAPVAERQRQLRSELASLPEPGVDLEPLLDLSRFRDDEDGPSWGPNSAWDNLPTDRKRSVLACLADSVIVHPKERKGRLTDEQVEMIWAS